MGTVFLEPRMQGSGVELPPASWPSGPAPDPGTKHCGPPTPGSPRPCSHLQRQAPARGLFLPLVSVPLLRLLWLAGSSPEFPLLETRPPQRKASAPPWLWFTLWADSRLPKSRGWGPRSLPAQKVPSPGTRHLRRSLGGWCLQKRDRAGGPGKEPAWMEGSGGGQACRSQRGPPEELPCRATVWTGRQAWD